jgi:hypothetical protein
VPAQNRGRQVREGLSGARAGFSEQRAAAREDAGHGRRHLPLSGPGLEVRHGPREGPVVGEDAVDGGV